MIRPALHALPTPAEILDAPERAGDLGPGEAAALAPRFAAALESLRIAAWRPLPAASAPAEPSEPALADERWLRPAEAAAIAAVERRTIYEWSRRSDWRPFIRRPSKKVLRIEESAFRRWLDAPKRGTR